MGRATGGNGGQMRDRGAEDGGRQRVGGGGQKMEKRLRGLS